MATIGVVLSGCGVYDGAEIHEAVLTMLAIDEAGHDALLMAPRGPQRHVIDHATGQPADEARDVFAESARIARGKLRDLATVQAAELDALVFPGGFGVAKNLCDFAVAGADARPLPAVAALVGAVQAAGKPIGFACISPALAAAIFREAGVPGVLLTVGDADDEAAVTMRAMGAEVVACPVREVRVDRARKVVSTPAYMTAARITEVRDGVKAMVDEVLALMP
ncbi:MAG: isoprenoid biosynthesis glyoxalase ElbB [Myxococcales bacterium]|nr:isoprenoid biosynthesis glyoxalase ElbB [Myxococcales bacterium]